MGRISLFLEILALYFWKGLGRSLPEHVHGTFGLDLRGYSGPVVSSVGGWGGGSDLGVCKVKRSRVARGLGRHEWGAELLSVPSGLALC